MNTTKNILLSLLIIGASGCAYLRSTTSTATDPKSGIVTQRTTVRAYSVFDAQAQLTKFRNSNGGPTNNFSAGTSVGTLNEQSSASNLVAIIQAAAAAAAGGVK